MTMSRTRAVALMLLLLAGIPDGSARADARLRLAQGTVTIPSDAQINRLEREAITTPPLDVGETPRDEPGAAARHRDRREHRIDRRNPERGGACDDC
jgi:hypothetical protein